MAELDHQMALLLQYKFDRETKPEGNASSDYQFALQLQEEFKAEKEKEKPKPNSTLNSSKSLIDPSWEMIDPIPDVHVLFVTFSERFFWNKLQTVTVSWSKRMTSCAGICSYQDRSGFCSISLSEPLLKLRPRKDLVETLLHEMIHAYLFVTKNNKDREGHGPEFHKHMYRINAEAGTHITVYHDFHDEVRSYQQHCWRCDGPCQNWKPYFGVVRRAMNRAPGPNDRWWSDHAQKCGGKFIKFKGPEKPPIGKTKLTKTSKEIDPKSDIRQYIPTISKEHNTNLVNKGKQLTSFNRNSTNINLPKASSFTNIHTFSNNSNNTSEVGNVISKTSNIFGFTNLNGSNSNQKENVISGLKGDIKNTRNSLNNNYEIKKFPSTSSQDNKDYSIVRDHWLNKFDNNINKGRKRPSVTSLDITLPKISKKQNSNRPKNDNDTTAQCPVCKSKFDIHTLNNHLDHCLEQQSKMTKDCIICGIEIPACDFETHVIDCSEKRFGDDTMEKSGVSIKRTNETNIVDLTELDSHLEGQECPVCKNILSAVEYDCHVEQCLLKIYDDLDKKYGFDKSSKTSCLACNKVIFKVDLNSHLEDCRSMGDIFSTTNVPVKEDEHKSEKETKNQYNCPFCFRLFLESEMHSHLDKCLKDEDSTGQFTNEKQLVM